MAPGSHSVARNRPQQPLESWKQIAAYLDCSERTVRRWEAREGLPVHRREHHKQDKVFAYPHELDSWRRRRTRTPSTPSPAPEPQIHGYLLEHAAITATMHCYIAGARAGDSSLMRPAFHPAATISGYCQGVEYIGSIQLVFDWIDGNGFAPDLEPRFARIEIIESIALVHLEMHGWSGRNAGANAHYTDVFTLLKIDGEWKITHKLFHSHVT